MKLCNEDLRIEEIKGGVFISYNFNNGYNYRVAEILEGTSWGLDFKEGTNNRNISLRLLIVI